MFYYALSLFFFRIRTKLLIVLVSTNFIKNFNRNPPPEQIFFWRIISQKHLHKNCHIFKKMYIPNWRGNNMNNISTRKNSNFI